MTYLQKPFAATLRFVTFPALSPLLLGLGLSLSGCGMPGAPQPPSLNLPQPVVDLKAVRNGNQVDLQWTMPRRNTDQVLLKDPVQVRVCRADSPQASCSLASTLFVHPAVGGSFQDTLPATLASGKPRPLRYYLELTNSRGRSAGPSNRAAVVAGQAPAPVEALTAEVHKNGTLLRWKADPADPTPVRLHRLLLTAARPSTNAPLAPLPEVANQNLLVTTTVEQGRALDRSTHFGSTYEFQAQRVARVQADGATVELAGAFSSPVRIEVKDLFPPDQPSGLVAVGAVDDQQGVAIDLSWLANTEADLAGYIVYRAESDSGWQRVSPEKPLAGPAFHDAAVLPGHSYRYTVSAVDLQGHASTHSAEARETAPQP
jgi:hypothetical protein